MGQTSEGAKKAAQTTRDRHGKDFHSKAAAKAWDNPNRSRKVGFAAMDKEKVKELARKGGSKTKDEYREKTEAEKFEKEVRTAFAKAKEERSGAL